MITKPCDQAIRRKILAYIIQYKQAHDGNPPRPGEIARAVGIHEPNAFYYLRQMSKDGMIQFGAGMISVPGGKWIYEGEK